MILWKKQIRLRSGGTIDIYFVGNGIADIVEFWNGADGIFLMEINRLVTQYEKSRKSQKQLTGTDNSDSPDSEKMGKDQN